MRQKIAPMLRASWQQSENKTTCMSANEYVYVYVRLYAHYLIFSIRSDQYSILLYIYIYTHLFNYMFDNYVVYGRKIRN